MTKTEQAIEKLTAVVEKLVSKEVAPVLPVAPVAPVLPIIPANSGDHDLLLRLEENVNLNFRQVKEAIKELGDGTSAKLSDHETRIRKNEEHLQDFPLIKKLVFGAVSFILLSVLSAVVYLVIQH